MTAPPPRREHDDMLREAVRQWGAQAFAHHAHKAGVFEVGFLRGQWPVVMGRGKTWAEAFADARLHPERKVR